MATDGLVFGLGVCLDEERPSSALEETRSCIRMLEEALAEAGCTIADVAKVTVYLADRDDFAEMNEAYREAWTPPDYPLRFVVYSGLAPGVRVMMDATAVKQEV
ncbi:MAG: RidA family protein [Actinobacteria bacterium]|nr:RidA family protein [Actinomycetota bacterium]